MSQYAELIARALQEVRNDGDVIAGPTDLVRELCSALSLRLREISRDAYQCCMSAWSCGEPLHRVKDMLNAVERLGSHLGEPGAPAIHPTDNDHGDGT